jgi:hypothetical protein
MRLPLFPASILLLALASAPVALAQQGMLKPEVSNGVPYLSGGIGDEERDEIDRARPGYNTKLVLSEASGSYVADVKLTVANALGEPIVSIAGAGPLVLLQLPPGSYLVTASLDGRTVQKRLNVRDNTARTVSIVW